MQKKTWTAPTIKPLASAKDAKLGVAGAKDGLVTKQSATS
jgi:hypothetical protein